MVRQIKYFVRWESTVTGGKGRGEGIAVDVSNEPERVRVYDQLAKLAATMNDKYPELKHQVDSEFCDRP